MATCQRPALVVLLATALMIGASGQGPGDGIPRHITVFNEGLDLLRAGDFVGAWPMMVAASADAAADGFSKPLAGHVYARACFEMERLRDALVVGELVPSVPVAAHLQSKLEVLPHCLSVAEAAGDSDTVQAIAILLVTAMKHHGNKDLVVLQREAEVLQRALSVDGDASVLVRLNLGVVLLAMGRLDDAESALRAVIEAVPNTTTEMSARMELGNVLFYRDLLTEAVEQYRYTPCTLPCCWNIVGSNHTLHWHARACWMDGVQHCGV